MKQRILLIAVLLLVATPAFATVTINVTQGTGTDANLITVSYNNTAGEAVRAFALDFTIGVTSPLQMVWSGVRDFNKGDSTTSPGGYGIFPGQFRNQQINPADPNWNNQYYYPVAPTGDIDSNDTGISLRKVICELGTLYTAGNAPGTSGTLFKLLVDFNSVTTATPLTVVANAVRGGVVLENGTSVTPTINAPANITPPVSNVTISGQVVGAVAPKNTGIGGVTMSGLPGNPLTDASGNYSVTVAAGSYTVTPTDPNGQWSFVPASFACGGADLVQNVTGTALECLNKLDTSYVKWVTYNKPNCWCYKKQCRGDADGKNTLSKPVASPDLTVFKSAVGQTAAYVKTLMVGTVPGICSDFDRKDTLSKPVASPDLTIFKSYVGLADTSVPVCPSATVNAWKN